LDGGVRKAGVRERLLTRLLRHVGIVPGLGAGLLELRHADPDHVNLATHALRLLLVRSRSRAPARSGAGRACHSTHPEANSRDAAMPCTLRPWPATQRASVAT